LRQNADGKRNLRHGKSFVEMAPAAQKEHRHIVHPTAQQLAGVPMNFRNGKASQLPTVNFGRNFEPLLNAAMPAAQDDG
jgi:hypothetical protein